jgi:hypothetical protein
LIVRSRAFKSLESWQISSSFTLKVSCIRPNNKIIGKLGSVSVLQIRTFFQSSDGFRAFNQMAACGHYMVKACGKSYVQTTIFWCITSPVDSMVAC